MNPSKLLTPIAIAAYCFSAAAAPTGGARRFAPVGFVARKGDGDNNNNARLVPARKFQELVPPASLLSFRGGGGTSEEAEGEGIKANARDVVSYVTDVALTCVLIFFGYYWIKSKILLGKEKIYDKAPPFFFKEVLEKGFCNKDLNTKLLCCIADFAMVAAAGVIAKGKGDKVFKNYFFFAAYTIVHGLIHLGEWVTGYRQSSQVASSGWRSSAFKALEIVLDPLGVILLAIITGLAPYALGSVLSYVLEKPEIGDLLLYCIPPWLAAVALFNSGIGFEKADALTYINFVTFLCFYTPRALLMGLNDPKQIKARRDMDKIFGNFTAFTVTSVIVFFIMVSEPIYCGTWFGKAGGHLLFDFALYAYLNVPVFTKPAEE